MKKQTKPKLKLKEEPRTVVQDVCTHYQPDKTRPIGEQSSKQGQLYECQNIHLIPGQLGCVNCYNLKYENGNFHNHPERVRDGIADFQMK